MGIGNAGLYYGGGYYGGWPGYERRYNLTRYLLGEPVRYCPRRDIYLPYGYGGYGAGQYRPRYYRGYRRAACGRY
jgi:hypothetical protein